MILGYPSGRLNMRIPRYGQGCVNGGMAIVHDGERRRMNVMSELNGGCPVRTLTRHFILHAQTLAQEIDARALLIYADVVAQDEALRELLSSVDFPVILMRREREKAHSPQDSSCFHSIFVPDVHMTRTGQVKVAVLVCLAQGVLSRGDRVVCLSGIDQSGLIDCVFVVNLDAESELFAMSIAVTLQGDFRVEVFERILSLATQLGVEGREGQPIGTAFILGDSVHVLEQSRQLVLNPFRGYDESERNILDPQLEETIKEFASIDGAYIVRGDGVVLSAGTQLLSQARFASLLWGLGTRHAAAAAITASTGAVAITISQSTGTVSVFKGGQMIMDIHKPSNSVRPENVHAVFKDGVSCLACQ